MSIFDYTCGLMRNKGINWNIANHFRFPAFDGVLLLFSPHFLLLCFRCSKCEHGVNFCVAKHTPYQGFRVSNL